jgi:putative CocE/NonD family hydrolase
VYRPLRRGRRTPEHGSGANSVQLDVKETVVKTRTGRVALLSLVPVVVMVTLFSLYKRASRPKMMSQLGEYWGYSAVVYDSNERRSAYMTLKDGTQLAYDLILPTKDGVSADRPLPVLFKYTPYLRAFTLFGQDGKLLLEDLYDLKWYEKVMLRVRHRMYDRGHLMDPVFRTKWLGNMLQHGYAVIVVERPGTGASFGTLDPSFEVGADEVDQILDWIAVQDWCDGNIGMFGDSWQAMIQFAAASAGNPHLKAILPISSSIDSYSAVSYPGGVYNRAFNSLFSRANAMLEALVTPVDGDENRVLLAQALAERSGSTVGKESAEFLSAYPYRDSVNARGEKVWEEVMALYPFLDRINRSGVPTYLVNGWYDLFTADMFVWYANLTVPRRLLVRPLDHSEIEGDGAFDLAFGAEAHRWFDYWLKGIDNGIMDEPPIHYYVIGAPQKAAWQTADQWPLPGQGRAHFYFREGKTGSVGSINDGFLRPEPPSDLGVLDVYGADYGTTSGEHTRWNAVLDARDYPDMRANDEKALTYTTPPLDEDVEVTGHPVAHIWLTTDVPDLDLFVYLVNVDGRGRATYVTEGNLRASHRAQSEPSFDNLGLPYQRHYEGDLAPIPAREPVELILDLLPTSYLFRAGSRIRITIACADAGNFDTPRLDPVPAIRLLRDAIHASVVELPIILNRQALVALH